MAIDGGIGSVIICRCGEEDANASTDAPCGPVKTVAQPTAQKNNHHRNKLHPMRILMFFAMLVESLDSWDLRESSWRLAPSRCPGCECRGRMVTKGIHWTESPKMEARFRNFTEENRNDGGPHDGEEIDVEF